MGIKVKAIERNVSFEKGKEKWAYVLQANLYGRLDDAKVINEATVRSGLPKAIINAGWTAIGEVIKAWATEGHSVAIPGLGTLRFGLNSEAVEDVNKVSASLINRRYIIFVPNTEIKEELQKTAVSITCYDRNGKVVKQVTSTDKPSEGDDNTDPSTPSGGGSGSGGDTGGSGSGTGGSGSSDSGNTGGSGSSSEEMD